MLVSVPLAVLGVTVTPSKREETSVRPNHLGFNLFIHEFCMSSIRGNASVTHRLSLNFSSSFKLIFLYLPDGQKSFCPFQTCIQLHFCLPPIIPWSESLPELSGTSDVEKHLNFGHVAKGLHVLNLLILSNFVSPARCIADRGRQGEGGPEVEPAVGFEPPVAAAAPEAAAAEPPPAGAGVTVGAG